RIDEVDVVEVGFDQALADLLLAQAPVVELVLVVAELLHLQLQLLTLLHHRLGDAEIEGQRLAERGRHRRRRRDGGGAGRLDGADGKPGDDEGGKRCLEPGESGHGAYPSIWTLGVSEVSTLHPGR